MDDLSAHAKQRSESETLYGLFHRACSLHPKKRALMYKGEGKKYEAISYGEVDESVTNVAAFLTTLGVEKGDAIAIFSNNRPEWAIADLAVLKRGGIVVAIYPTLPPSQVKYVVNDSRMKLIFVENARLFSIIEGVRTESPRLEKVILFDDSGIAGEKEYVRFEEMKRRRPEVADEGEDVSGTDVATIVYTSGTTGEPKGVVLTHGNIVSNTLSIVKRCRVTHEDVVVSYLPLSHMFERTCGYYAMLFCGASIAFAEDLSTLAEDVATIRPTVLLAVPRVIEKAYDTVVKQVEGSSPLKRLLVSFAIKNLNRYANLTYRGMRVPVGLRAKCAVCNTFVASAFRKIAGGRLRIIASGGAPLDQKIAKVLHILGFNLMEGYGLTETSPIVCCHTLDDRKLGTVGKPLDGIDVVIGENDEILVKGPNVMRGYLNKPDETADVIDEDGWFHTGDRGRLDEDGNLIITGRIKELIVTSYGKNVASASIEAQITKSRYVAQAVLYGDKKKYIVALIVPDREGLRSYAQERGIDFDSFSELLEKDEIREVIRHDIEEATADLAPYEKIKAFALIPEEFTVENGMLTPTLKLRRNRIFEKYRQEVDGMYGQSEGGLR